VADAPAAERIPGSRRTGGGLWVWLEQRGRALLQAQPALLLVQQVLAQRAAGALWLAQALPEPRAPPRAALLARRPKALAMSPKAYQEQFESLELPLASSSLM